MHGRRSRQGQRLRHRCQRHGSRREPLPRQGSRRDRLVGAGTPEAARFLRACYDDLAPAQDCFVWNGWQSAIAMLGLAELKSLVKQAFERGSIEAFWLSFEHFEHDLAHAIENPDWRNGSGNEYTLFGDTIEELSAWYGFTASGGKDERRRAREAAERRLSAPTTVAMFPKTGRNDRCPCGSGKKFKKCCLN
jgi:hypothetical protein